jgi:hypothetical protein
VRLEDLRRRGILHRLLDAPPVVLHDPEVELLGPADVLLDGHVLAAGRVVDGGVVVRPPVVDEVGLDGAPQHQGLEVVHAGLLPARLQTGREVGRGRPVAPLADGGRGPLEHDHVLGRVGQRGQALDARGAGADEADDLVAELGERLAGATAGDGVVPPGGVEGRPREVLHAGDGGQLEEVEEPHRQHVVAGAERVAAVGLDPPAGGVLVPLGADHARVEQGVRHEVEPLRDRLQVPADLLAVGVAVGRDVVELLQEGEVHVRLDVAHDPRVAVPVPRAPDAAGLVDDADALDAGLAQLGAGDEPRDPAPHDHDVDVLDHRVPVGHRGERIVPEPGEVLVARQVADGGPAGDQAPVPLGEVLGVDDVGVVPRRLVLLLHRSPSLVAPGPDVGVRS